MMYQCYNKDCIKFGILNNHPPNNTSHIDVMNMDLPIKKHVMCNQCGVGWVICTICNKKFNMQNMYLANAHFDEKHNCVDSKNPNEIEIDIHHSDDNDYINDNYSISTLSFDGSQTDSKSGKRKQSISNTTYIGDVSNADMSSHHKEYFKAEIEEQGQGLKKLITKAVTGYSTSHLTEVENMYHLDVAQFCNSLDHSQKEQFARIMQNTVNIEKFMNTRPPHSVRDINQFYTKSQSSIFQSLPSPTIHNTESHVYISLTSVIDYFLAYGHIPDYMTHVDDVSKKHGIVTCQQSIKIREEVKQNISNSLVPMILYLIFWSDDFEGSMLRKNKNSVWIKTVTISPPPDQQTSTKYTYVIAMGRKSNNHDEVNKIHNEELEQLNKCTFRYYGASHVRRNIPVIVQTLAVLADRPERCSMNFILGHTGTTTKRWGYAAYLNTKYMPSCSLCFKHRLQNINTTARLTCYHCCDWNYSTNCRHIKHPLPDGYPTKQHDLSPTPPKGREVIDCRALTPIKQTFDILISACKFCAFNYWSKQWTKKM